LPINQRCSNGSPQRVALAERLSPEWSVESGHHLICTDPFKNFNQALTFTNAIGEVAEQENHHPEITLTWGCFTLCSEIESGGFG